MTWLVSKANVKLVAQSIANASAMNGVTMVCVNHFVAAMMIADMVKCVKISFVQLVADPMQIVEIVWLVLASVVWIHAKKLPRAVQTLIASYKIMLNPASVQTTSLEIQLSDVNMHQLHAQPTTNAHQITRATEMYAKPAVKPIKIVWPMSDAYVALASQFVTVMHHVVRDKFARIDCVKLVVATI